MYSHDPQKFGAYRVKVTIQYQDYKGHLYYDVESYGYGYVVLSTASEITKDDIIDSDCNFRVKDYDEDNPEWEIMFEAELVNEKGESCTLEERICDLDYFITGIEIVDFQEKKED